MFFFINFLAITYFGIMSAIPIGDTRTAVIPEYRKSINPEYIQKLIDVGFERVMKKYNENMADDEAEYQAALNRVHPIKSIDNQEKESGLLDAYMESQGKIFGNKYKITEYKFDVLLKKRFIFESLDEMIMSDYWNKVIDTTEIFVGPQINKTVYVKNQEQKDLGKRSETSSTNLEKKVNNRKKISVGETYSDRCIIDEPLSDDLSSQSNDEEYINMKIAKRKSISARTVIEQTPSTTTEIPEILW
uniref:Uncharacterized protein n=1 Tax=Rhabditophanes sp. KR3021 TaxID=114890 RepID=A0AC35TIA7_9BILA